MNTREREVMDTALGELARMVPRRETHEAITFDRGWQIIDFVQDKLIPAYDALIADTSSEGAEDVRLGDAVQWSSHNGGKMWDGVIAEIAHRLDNSTRYKLRLDGVYVEAADRNDFVLINPRPQPAQAEQGQQEPVLLEALKSIRQFGADTLSGRTDGPDDRDWQRAAVREMTRRARLALESAQPQPPPADQRREIAALEPECWGEQPRGLPAGGDGSLAGSYKVAHFAFDPALHPDTANLVAAFAGALAAKLFAAQEKYGYSDGWNSPDWMDECRTKLIEHVAKGDPRDVAAYCAFLWHHGERTALAASSQPPPSAGSDVRTEQDAYELGYHNPSTPSHYFEWRHLVDVNAFHSGQLDSQNQNPMNREYRRADYEPDTGEKLAAPCVQDARDGEKQP